FRFLRWIYLIDRAMDNDGRDTDLGELCQLRLDRGIPGIAISIAYAMPVRVNDDIDKILIFERRRGSAVGGLVKRPGWRPKAPQQFANVGAHLSEAFTAPLRIEVKLIPKSPFLFEVRW